MRFVEPNSIATRRPATAVVAVAAIGLGLCLATTQAQAATLSRSVTVPGTPAEVWSMIGPFCAIKDWLPPVGSCNEDGQRPPTRTLVTRDGTATFVERQAARSDSAHFYSYTFVSSPLPVSHYVSTIRVTASKGGRTTVTWRGSYVPAAGKAADAAQALDGIYAAGLDSIRAQARQRFAGATRSGAGQ